MLRDGEAYYDKSITGLDAGALLVSNSQFEGCCFSDSDLSNVVFNNCRFVECDFKNTNLSLVEFRNTLLSEVCFDQCKMIGIDWTKLRWPSIQVPGLLSFKECIMDDSVFFGVFMSGTTLVSCRLHRVVFNEAICEESDFSNSDLMGATFHKTRLARSVFVDAINYYIDVMQNQIKGARFSLPEAVSLLNGLDIELQD